MQELIKIKTENNQALVSGRDLHSFLESKQQFADWIKGRIEKYDLVEGHDYMTFSESYEKGRPSVQYALTIDAAKELAMVEGNEKGKEARRYFIACEKELKNTSISSYQAPQTYADALRQLADQVEEKEKMQKQLEAAKPKIEFYNAVTDSRDAVPMANVAKVLGIKGLGQNNLFQKLRELNILMTNNIPYQEFIDRGYFRVIEQKYTTPKGEVKISFKTLVFQRGVDFIRKKIS